MIVSYVGESMIAGEISGVSGTTTSGTGRKKTPTLEVNGDRISGRFSMKYSVYERKEGRLAKIGRFDHAGLLQFFFDQGMLNAHGSRYRVICDDRVRQGESGD